MPIIKEIKARNISGVKQAIENGESVNTIDEQDVARRPTLSWVGECYECSMDVRAKLDEIGKLLLEYGANPNIPTPGGHTSLYTACYFGRVKYAELLLAHGAKIDIRSNDGNTPLVYAPTSSADPVSLSYLTSIIELLLKNNADPNAKGYGGNTALHNCILNPKIDSLVRSQTIQLLLNWGANPSQKNDLNKTPADLARDNKQPEIAKLLEQCSQDITMNLHLGEKQKIFNEKFITYKIQQQRKQTYSKSIIDLDSFTSTNRHYNLLQPSVKNWITALPENLKNDESINLVIKESFSENLRESNQTNKSITPLQLDVQVIDKALAELIKHPPANLHKTLPAFVKHAESIIQYHHAQAKALNEQLVTANPLAQHVQALTLSLQQSGIQVSSWVSQIQEAAKSPQNFIKSISKLPVPKELKGVLDTLNHVAGEANQAFDVTKQLFEKMTTSITSVDKAWNEVKSLEKNLTNLISTGADKLEIATTRARLQLATSECSQREITLNTTLQGIGKGFEFAGTLASLLGNPKLGQQIVAIGASAVSIVQGVSGISAIVAGTASGSILGPVGMIGGAVISILGALGIFGNNASSPSPEQEMMQQLSEQICKLGKHLDQRFDHIEKMLVIMHKDIMQEFKTIQGMIDQFYLDTMNEFRQVKSGIGDLKRAAKVITKKLDQINNKLDIGFRELYSQHYTEAKQEALQLERYYKNDPKELQKAAKKYAQILTNWATQAAKRPILTGLAITLNPTEINRAIAESNGVAFIINLLAKYTGYDSALANPIAWADAANTYLEMLQHTSNLEVDWDYKADINDMINVGLEINQFISHLQAKKNNICIRLCKIYRNNLESLLNKFKSLEIGKNIIEKNKNDLEELKTTYQLLLIFSQLAFPKQYQEDTAFATNLQLNLWNENDLVYFTGQVTTAYNKSFVYSTIRQSALKAIEDLEMQLLTMIVEAELKQEKVGHPMVDKVIKELELFKICYMPKIKVALLPNRPDSPLSMLFKPQSDKDVVKKDKDKLKSLLRQHNFSISYSEGKAELFIEVKTESNNTSPEVILNEVDRLLFAINHNTTDSNGEKTLYDSSPDKKHGVDRLKIITSNPNQAKELYARLSEIKSAQQTTLALKK